MGYWITLGVNKGDIIGIPPRGRIEYMSNEMELEEFKNIWD